MTARAVEGRPGADGTQAPGQVRRVVTGHDATGRSVVLSDDLAGNVFRSDSVPGLGSAVAWTSPPEGARNDGDGDPAGPEVEVPMYPRPGGTIFRVADFPPDSHYGADAAGTVFSDIGAPEARVTEADGSRHFWSHKTDSLDYAVVLEGEIWMIMDEGECLVRAGDVIVQRGTAHAWSNRSDQRCRMAFVLLGTPPLHVADQDS